MREVIVRLPDPADVQRLIEYARHQFNAIAFEAHIPQNGEPIALDDVRDYYEDGFVSHPHVEDLLQQGYELTPWDQLSHEDRCQFAGMVTLYSQRQDYLNADLIVSEPLEEFAYTHQNWLSPAS